MSSPTRRAKGRKPSISCCRVDADFERVESVARIERSEIRDCLPTPATPPRVSLNAQPGLRPHGRSPCPSKAVVDTAPHDVGGEAYVIAGRQAASHAAAGLAKIDVKVLGFHGPGAREGEFETATCGPTGIRLVDTGKAGHRGLDITDRETAGHVG